MHVVLDMTLQRVAAVIIKKVLTIKSLITLFEAEQAVQCIYVNGNSPH